ncbi:hypothetical protein [Paucilactobacillus kaifaensis]|uniref:hypothetical protein n=1 Tax=Paucilactobacillus kaifaensis TaxID=2559921 RepID=UPI0010F79962|nr:hypothetical protein [Paucilactobacillus kaifaensis]
MVLYLVFLAILSLVFLLMIFTHYRKTVRTGRPENLAFVRIIVSWVLLLTFFGSTGTAIYAATHKQTAEPKDDTSKAVKQTSESTSKKLAAVGVEFTPKDPVLKNGKVEVTFKVSPQTKLQVLGHYSKKNYKSFDANDSYKTETFKHAFTAEGEYDIVAQRGSKKVVKHLTVTENAVTSSSDSSSSSSVQASSSSAVVSSSQRSYSSPSASRNYTGSTYSGGGTSNSGNNAGSQAASSSETGTVITNEYSEGQ